MNYDYQNSYLIMVYNPYGSKWEYSFNKNNVHFAKNDEQVYDDEQTAKYYFFQIRRHLTDSVYTKIRLVRQTFKTEAGQAFAKCGPDVIIEERLIGDSSHTCCCYL